PAIEESTSELKIKAGHSPDEAESEGIDGQMPPAVAAATQTAEPYQTILSPLTPVLTQISTLRFAGDGSAIEIQALPTPRTRAQSVRPASKSRSLPLLSFAIGALIALNVALIGWRKDVVRVAPQTASLYAKIGLPVNLRGLSFIEVATAVSLEGAQVLVVRGTIA